jgi:general secretion pathway protein F
MPLYRYKALNSRGEVLDGQMEAASDGEVAARLQEQGHLPMEAKLASEAGSGTSLRSLFQAKPFAGERLVQFTQQLATLLGAGQPLDRSLTILLELPEDDKARRTITDIRDAVRGGAPLSTALERQHGAFSRLYVNMVRAGEAGGSMHETLQRLADYLERSSALRGLVINAMVYPAILVVVVGFALLFLLGFVVPQFAQMYESLDVVLPWFTRAVLALGLLRGLSSINAFGAKVTFRFAYRCRWLLGAFVRLRRASHFSWCRARKVTKRTRPGPVARPVKLGGFACCGRVRLTGHPWPDSRIRAIPRASR